MMWRAVHEGQFMGVLRQPGYEFESDQDHSHWAVRLVGVGKPAVKLPLKPPVDAVATKSPSKRRSAKLTGDK